MDSALRSLVHDLVLGRSGGQGPWQRGARAILTADIKELLEGTYGVHDSGRIQPEDRLPNLAHDPEARETYRRVTAHLKSEQAAGRTPAEAVDKLIREVAFTHLNRLVAFKMMEARGLIRGTLARYPRPNGFLRYLAEHPEDEQRYTTGDEYTAYRNFLIWQSAQVAAEIRVLFDPDSLASRLFPRRAALREVIELLNDPAVAPAWAEDETIGWVYQYFNARELEQAFREFRLAGKKFAREDVPSVTQLFTPRWIVEFLVQNTLGRTWIQMHPDSRLKERMPYLVPLAGEIPREPLKPVSEITVLDPACGTMHFGLVAFDLLAEMYREELEHAGEPGWPAEPSVASEAEIPAAIVANNLFGIDIDLRAVQLAALTLYLKAKSLNKDAVLTRSNLVCADVLPFRQRDLEAFLAANPFERPVYERILRALWPRLAEVSDLGSLACLERAVAEVIAEERKRERQSPLFADVVGTKGPVLSTEDQWRAIADHIVWALDHYAHTATDRGEDVRLFVGEATKGLRLLHLLRRRYDVVVTNPPYMSSRKMNPTLAKLVARDYPQAKRDLYAAFIQRCLELTREGGRTGLLTMQSFMFLGSYEALRQGLLDNVGIETIAHLGPALFDVGNPGTLQTAAYVLHREGNAQRRQDSIGTYFRLVREPDAEAKRRRFEQALAALRCGENDPLVFRYREADFNALPGAPWVYWIRPGIRRLFQMLPKLAEIGKPRQGLATADNFRFLRYWWEVGSARIAFRCRSRGEAVSSGKRWFPLMKGGEYRKWYGNQDHTINWHEDGKELKAWAGSLYNNSHWSRTIRNSEYYFREGVTWTVISSRGFSARYMGPGFIIGHKGPAVFPDTPYEPLSITATLNSSIAQYLLALLSPALGFEVGHLALLPVPPAMSSGLAHTAHRAVALAKADSAVDETTYDFTAPLPWECGLEMAARRAAWLAEIEREIDEEVYRLYGISDEDRAAIEAELAGGMVIDDEEAEAPEAEETAPKVTRQELAVRWVSYAVGIIMGRFQPGVEGALGSAIVESWEGDGEPQHLFTPEVEAALRAMADRDGIVVLDEGHPDDLAARVEQALELMLGPEGAREVVAEIGGDVRKFLERDFFTKWHLKWYRKRPVYWPLQSPKRTYGLYLFHERITPDTLFLVQRRYVDPKLTWLDNKIADLRGQRDRAEGRERTRVQRELDAAVAQREDVAEFARRLAAITDRGYAPDLDDGVILNMAPLWEVIPAWSAEPKKSWEALERGDYDWAKIAMRYWPERVEAKCRTDKSLAIAHGRLDLYEEPATAQSDRSRRGGVRS